MTQLRGGRLLGMVLAFVGCTKAPPPEPVLRRELALLHVANLHSHLFPENVTLTARDVELGLGASSGDTVSVGGAARLATILDEERAHADVAVTLDAGDVFEGTAVYTLFGGVPEMRVVDALGIDADAVGNHDFSPGLERLAVLRRYAPESALLAANLGADAPGLVVPSVLVDRGGLRVEVVGLGRSPERDPDVAACAAEVQRQVDGSDADVVVVLSHLGTELDRALVPLTTGVDVLLGGHTHDVIAPPLSVLDCGAELAASRGCRPAPVLVVHSGAYGRYVGRVAVTVSTDAADRGAARGRRSAVVGVHSELIPVTAAVAERADVLDLLEPYRRAMAGAGLDQPLAFAPRGVSRTAPRGGDSALGNFVTGVMRAAAGADIAILNTTGLRDDLPAGELTAEDVFNVLPFDDRLVVADVSGSALLDAVEAIRRASCDREQESQAQLDGATLALACSGRGSAELRVAGHPIRGERTYRVATVSFLAEAGQWLDSAQAVDAGTTTDLGLLRDAVFAELRVLPSCSGNTGDGLPCVDGTVGGAVDGRISWH